MLNFKVLNILASSETTFRNRFHKYVSSPYFNSNESVSQLLDLYEKNIRDKSLEELTKDEIWKIIYPSVEFDDKKLRQLNTKLLSLFEDFIAQENYNADKFQKSIYQLKFLQINPFETIENQLIKASKVIGDRYQEMSADYHLNMYLVERSYFELTSDFEKKRKKKSKFEKFNFEQILNHLDTFYLAEKLRFLYTQLFWEDYNPAEKTDLLNDEILELVDKGKFRKDPLLLSFYYAIRTITNPDKEEYYFHLKKLVGKYFYQLNSYNKVFLFDVMFTYCVRQKNRNNAKYEQESLEIYKDALSKGVLIQNEKFSVITFRNIIFFALKAKDYEWTESFINEYSKYLPEGERDNAVNFNLARIYFYQKDYESALMKLNQVDLEDVHYTLIARSLIVILYYELKEFDAMLSSIDSFRVYLNRTKILSKDRINRFKNYLKYIKKIAFLNAKDSKVLSKLHAEIQDAKVTNKALLLEKIEELGYKPLSV